LALICESTACQWNRCAAGAGGSININAGTFTTTAGTPKFTANGGIGGNDTSRSAGGAGGRIAFYYTTITGLSVDTTLSTAYGANMRNDGSAGTIFYKKATDTDGHLLIDNNSIVGTNLEGARILSPGSANIDFDTVTIDNAGVLTQETNAYDITIQTLTILEQV
jgi:hypothetical protein